MTAANRELACLGVSITCPIQTGRFGNKPSHPDGTVLGPRKRSPKWYGRIPASALLDPGLNSDAVRIFGILSLKTQGNISTFGMREIGKAINRGRSTVQRRLHELVAHGDIKMSTGANGQRARYELTSPVFIGKASVQPDAALTKPARHKPSVLCPNCRRLRHGLLRVGICRSCNLDLKLDRKVIAAVDNRLRATA